MDGHNTWESPSFAIESMCMCIVCFFIVIVCGAVVSFGTDFGLDFVFFLFLSLPLSLPLGQLSVSCRRYDDWESCYREPPDNSNSKGK